MRTRRLRATFSTTALVVGALLVGDALHGAVVTGQYGLASPAAVQRLVGGSVAIAVGSRLRTPVGDRTTAAGERGADARDADGDPGGEFDPDLSPAGDALTGEDEEPDDDRR